MAIMEWITIIGIVVANAVTLFIFFINMNIKIAEINQRYISLQKEVTEHKSDNKETFNKIESLLTENKRDNKEDHGKFFDKLETISIQLSNATKTIISNNPK